MVETSEERRVKPNLVRQTIGTLDVASQGFFG